MESNLVSGKLMSMRAIILCGGSGSRLWPKSRESFPKQFIPMFDGKSLLDLTIERVVSLKFKMKPIFILNKKHGFLVKKALNKYNLDADIFLEPEGKNTCAAIYLSAKHSCSSDNLLIMPSDHFIPNKKVFVENILNLKKYISLNNWITLGIKPTKSSEAYGYIQVDEDKVNNIYKVKKFIEKPNKDLASQFVKDNSYYWNAGIFIANAAMVLKSIKKHAPNIALQCDKNFHEIKLDSKTKEFNFPKKLFSYIPSQSIDFAIMEKESNIYLYPFKSEWSDVGSWDAIAEINKRKPESNKVIQIESSNNFITTDNRKIATVGVKDLIIVDSDDAVLITKKDHSEKVKLVVNKLLERNFIEAKEHTCEYRPWGKFESLLNDKHCKVKRITVNPQKRLSLQYHNYRSEHWLIISGIANIHLDGKNFILTSGQSIDVPQRSHHYIENKNEDNLIVIETQLGSYFGEDDIVRLDDPYSR